MRIVFANSRDGGMTADTVGGIISANDVIRSISGVAPVGLTYHGRPAEECGDGVDTTPTHCVGWTLEPLKLEHWFRVVVPSAHWEKVSIVGQQAVGAFDTLESGLLGKVEIISVTGTAVEVGGDILTIILSVGGQAGHWEIDTWEHSVGTVAGYTAGISLWLRQMGCGILKVADGELDHVGGTVCISYRIVNLSLGVGIDDTLAPHWTDVPVGKAAHEAGFSYTLDFGLFGHCRATLLLNVVDDVVWLCHNRVECTPGIFQAGREWVFSEIGVRIDVVWPSCGQVVAATVTHAVIELTVERVPHIVVKRSGSLGHSVVWIKECVLAGLVGVGLVEKIGAGAQSHHPGQGCKDIYFVFHYDILLEVRKIH